MQRQNITHVFFFFVFFSIGAAALSISILLNDLLRYYHNKNLLTEAEVHLKQLESLNADYDALLEQLRTDPNLIRRIGPVTLGTEPADTNAVYPKVTAEQLAAAKKAFAENTPKKPGELPRWLTRCNQPFRRIALFLAGAFLIMISFICFRTTEKSTGKEQP